MREYVFPFEKIDVWKMAVDLAEYVLELLEGFPPNKYFRLAAKPNAAESEIPQI
jgi:hypothetical protein